MQNAVVATATKVKSLFLMYLIKPNVPKILSFQLVIKILSFQLVINTKIIEIF